MHRAIGTTDEDGGAPREPLLLPDGPPRRIRNLIDPSTQPGADVRSGANRAPTATEIAATFRSLGLLLSCGIPADRALRLMAAGSATKRLGAVLEEASVDVEHGAALSEALGRRGETLSSLLYPLLEAGETTGNMDNALYRFADLMESRSHREMQTRTALVYPLFLFAMCLAVIVLLPTFLLHGMFQLMGQLQVEVPTVTRALMTVSLAMRSPVTWVVMAGVVSMTVVGLRRWVKSPAQRRRVDALILRIPLVGSCAREIAVTHFVSTLEALISAGISSLTAVDVAARAAGNLEMSARLAAAGPALARGQSLHEALDASGCLPPLATQFIKAGEESGRLPDSLRRVAVMTEEHVAYRLDTALAALEPLMLWFMGCLVGVVCLATLQPFVHVVESLDR